MENKWPKKLLQLTPEQLEIKKDFMKHWHEVLPKRYNAIEKFNHGYPAQYAKPGTRVLEIGSGLGEHINYEDITNIEYYALEILPNMAEVIKERFPKVSVVLGDCQEHLDFPDQYFDRIIAIHVLEHLPNLPAALKHIRRVLKKDGKFCVVIPCEGGWAYSLARRISAKRIFEKRYKQNYDFFIKTEHVNMATEILEELEKHFSVVNRSFFPLKFPMIGPNLVIGLVLQPRES